jgi:hypothetical protein
MKYIKRFNEKQEKSIEDWCKDLNLHYFGINKDGSVDADRVHITNMKLNCLPIKFGTIIGNFDCRQNKLTTLVNSPIKILGSFYCSTNLLKSLEYCCSNVLGNFSCHNNYLTSLKGTPLKIFYDFYCSMNQLTSLEGCPREVIGDFICYDNKLTSLEGCPEKVGKHFTCSENPIYQVYKLFVTYERYKASLDYKYLRGTDIVRGRFKKACEDAKISMPDSIVGYKYI